VQSLGGLIDDTELVDGLVFTHKAVHAAGGPSRVENAKIGLIQFQLSSPKTNVIISTMHQIIGKNTHTLTQMENTVEVKDYSQMDRILKEEKNYLLGMCNKIKKAGCNVLLIQKSILRDAVNDVSLSLLAKLKILVVKDVERDDIEFISKVCTSFTIFFNIFTSLLIRHLVANLLLPLKLSLPIAWVLLSWLRRFMGRAQDW